ncbi:MAG TPA: Spy/CpxP family protein refolding chaperone [Chitinophagaceae bacterium]|nr:Spy/CpxP family protein refolding chaperone [Chitinophagaceae bacterium]
MQTTGKNKWLTLLVVLLLLANITTLALFWLDRGKRPPQPKGTPKEFLVKELSLTAVQQQQFDTLIAGHRKKSGELRDAVKAAKDSLFGLIKESAATDSLKQLYAKKVSHLTEQIDLLTVNHFQQVRKICTPEQQQKFDELILEVTSMMAPPRPPQGPGHPQGPPHDGPPPPKE